jgi:excisionase family DNA binding protein
MHNRSSKPSGSPPERTDSLLKKKQVAEMIACSVRHVERLAGAGRLTRVKLGRAVRFKLSEVMRLMQGGIA